LEVRKLELKKGQKHEILLKGLGSAGYSWKYTVKDSETIEISLSTVDIQSKPPEGAPPPQIYSKDQMLTITAKKAGVEDVYLVQSRSWEPQKPPLNELLIEITVVE
jgi:predicted secreted protein